MVVDGNVFCQRDGDDVFTADGEVRLAAVRVRGQLGFNHAVISASPVALALQEASVSSLWLEFGTRPEGALDLRWAEITRIYDRTYDEGQPWASTALAMCEYQSLDATGGPRVEARLQWLELDPEGYSPQPYEQLAAWYRRIGHDDDARDVAIAKERRRRSTLGFRGKLWSFFLGATVAHGYRPSQALGWLLTLLIFGGVMFGVVFDEDPPGDGDADLRPAKADPAPFQPVIFSLDLLVPVISLGQRVSWNTDGPAQWVALGMTICGWLLTAALLGGIAARRQ
jgi:hypothetical protein